jgi:large subunit ribosomal protein L17
MRHRKHNHQLGVKTAHRTSMLANLSCSLIENGRIKTTLARARALRQTIEKIVTLAKKAHLAQDSAKKIHYRRLAISRLRSKVATKKLFDELAVQFVDRQGGYTRIYKLALPRLGDAAEMALIEFVEEPESKKKKKKSKKTAKKAVVTDDKPQSESDEENKIIDETAKVESVSSDDSSKTESEEAAPAIDSEKNISDDTEVVNEPSADDDVSEGQKK